MAPEPQKRDNAGVLIYEERSEIWTCSFTDVDPDIFPVKM